MLIREGGIFSSESWFFIWPDLSLGLLKFSLDTDLLTFWGTKWSCGVICGIGTISLHGFLLNICVVLLALGFRRIENHDVYWGSRLLCPLISRVVHVMLIRVWETSYMWGCIG